MKKTKTTTTAEAPSKWPKILVRDYADGEGRERILPRLAAIELFQEVSRRPHKSREHAEKCIDGLLAGHWAGMEPMGSLTHFSRFTFEDSVKAAALDLLIAIKRLALNYEALLARSSDRLPVGVQSLDRARIAIAKAERIEPEDVSFIRTEGVGS